jgi:xanthine dehydrogenase accessory factor
MEVSRKVLRRAADLADAGQPFALCTVTATRGSVPGKVGAKMIVEASGAQFGTVGGAGLEERTKSLALKCIADRKSATQKFDLAYFRPGALDSLCGGTVEVLVEYMAAVPHILICGGGHVGLEVAKLCDQLEYVYSVLDDRPEFAGRERFPRASQLHLARPEAFFPEADLGAFSHVVILGYSHRVDTDILHHCCKRFSGYIGLICSKLKKREMFERMKERGVPESDLRRVVAPLGVGIGAETPAEIAVSILGGIIAHHKGVSDSQNQRPSPLEASDGEKAEPRDPDRQIQSAGKSFD